MADETMSAHGLHAQAGAMESAWEGGGSPYAVGSKKLGMWLFIVSDAITFSALLVAYSYVRVASSLWPRPFESASIINATVMTRVLLSSSLTMVMAVRESKRDAVPKTGGCRRAAAGGRNPLDI